MKTINVDHLPEPVVRAMEAVVKTLREQFRVEEKESGRCSQGEGRDSRTS